MRKKWITSFPLTRTVVYLLGRPCTVVTAGRSYKMLVMFFFFCQRQISELPRPIAVKLYHTIGSWFYFIMQVQKLGGSPKKNLGAKNMQNFGRFYTTSHFDRKYLRNASIKIEYLIDREQFLPRSTKKVR